MAKTQDRFKLDFEISYKNYDKLSNFLTERGRIIGRDRSGLSPKQQRLLAQEIKRARFLGLLPYRSDI